MSKLYRNHLYLPAGVCQYIALRHPDVSLAEGVRLALEAWHSAPHGSMTELRLPKGKAKHVEVAYPKRLSGPVVARRVIEDASNSGVLI